MKKGFFLIVLLFSLTGCMGSKNVAIDKNVAPTLNKKSMVLIQHENPSFIAMTSGKGMFALAGVGAAMESGNQLVEEHQIENPALTIAEKLANELNARYGMVSKGVSEIVVKTDEISEITAAAKGFDYAVAVKPVGWGFMYDGFNFSDYHINYTVTFKLIDVQNGKVVAEGFSNYFTKNIGKKPVTHETLLANQSEYIRQCLKEATAFCYKELSEKLF